MKSDRLNNETAKAKKHAGLKLRRMELAKVDPHPDNPRRHPEKGTPQWDALQKSLEADYFDPMVVNARNNMLVSGHYRCKVLLDMGVKTADMVVVNWDEPTHKARMLAANEPAGYFDDLKLTELLKTVQTGEVSQALTGITDERLDKLLNVSDQKAVIIQEQFSVMIDCQDEAQQKELLAQFETKGLKCRALIF